MTKARIFDLTLFTTSVLVALSSGHLLSDHSAYLKALIIYWLFSCLYYNLRVINKSGSTSVDYGISYTSSLTLFAGPVGVLIFETIFRFTIYFHKKWSNTADPGEFLDTFFNIGSFVLANSIGYYMYQWLYPVFASIPYGFWLLMILLIIVISSLTTLFLVIVLFIMGELRTLREAYDYSVTSRSFLDMGKIALTNGLLLIFLQEQRWDIIFSLFLLNYVVSRSFHSKSQSIQNKYERDKFEQMAYKDFLTGMYNRAYMDKQMAELNQPGDTIGIVVTDIDNFKRVNDSYNHAVGDQVIRHFARTLQSYLDGDDFLFRSGGEEFTFFLRNKGYADCCLLLEEMRRGVEDSLVQAEYGDQAIQLSYTASFGLYYFEVGSQASMEKGYIQADQLLLQAKHLGRNRVLVKNNSPEEDV
ncbi:GGDEF domain-containing protein [Paenibacillus tarimensis]|uniref:GGDEF domain-containing protein n=1 Tax=Paenibacillus tarimensis TaxID=416012 RepID=UPI001F3F633E|nr:GGDEF domain-containing protein [Paenibacillus tarimensis]MCF2944388.1 GGDEF domain-containing protein [Paenibacillus tarimensis]